MHTQIRSLSHRRRVLGARYDQLILSMPGVQAFWPQWETAGSVIHDLVVDKRAPDPASLDGTAVGYTWANDVGPFGWAAPYLDGANDCGDITTAGLASNFSAAEGTLCGWARVANSGIWSDGLYHQVVYLIADGNNFAEHRVDGGGIRRRYRAGGTASTVFSAIGDLPWHLYTLTWNKAADRVRGYLDDTLSGSASGLGVWAGALAGAYIGAANTTPTYPWAGWLGPIWFADVEWSPDDVKLASLA
jgi:hypothetical protein